MDANGVTGRRRNTKKATGKPVPAVPVIDVYARLSYAADGETVKVDDQVEMGAEAIERRGGRVGELFKDNSLSAWRPGVVRPDWDALMARLESGASHGVWVYDLTRFSRKIMEGERLVELADRGVRVWSNAGEYDLTSADGRKNFREGMVAAANESDKISERVRRGKLRRARKGRPSTGLHSFAVPGYLPRAKDAMPGDPRVMVTQERLAAERAIVRECYERLLAGEGISTLVNELNDRGSITTRGARWTRGHLVRMLRRPVLAGLLIHDGDIIGEQAGVDAVVTRQEWERLNALLQGRRRGRPAGAVGLSGIVHVLSNLMICGRCGRTVPGQSRAASIKPYPDGAPYREYRCAKTADRAGCGRNHLDARTAERAVSVAMRARLGDPRRAAQLAEHLHEIDTRRSELQAEISTLGEAADQIATRTATWGLERVDKAMRPLLARLEDLHAAVAGLGAPEVADTAAADAVAAWDEAEARRDYPAMRAMIRRTFPTLLLATQTQHNDHRPERVVWEPAPDQVPPPPTLLTPGRASRRW